MSDFNYFDELKNGGTQDWISYLNSYFINRSAPLINIFKLDKVKTKVDDLYGEEISSRIYLPPISMRAYHLDNAWIQEIGIDTMPYLETQENILFILNFQDMVNTMRNLKDKHLNDINISYSGNENVSALKSENLFILKKNGIIFEEIDLTVYDTVEKLNNRINSFSGFSSVFSGQNGYSNLLVSFNNTIFTNKILNVYTLDYTYENITEAIEKGDLILTNKWFLYEVLSNMPGGNFGWNFSTFVLKCNLRSLDKAQLPENYLEQIRKNEYSLRTKTRIE